MKTEEQIREEAKVGLKEYVGITLGIEPEEEDAYFAGFEKGYKSSQSLMESEIERRVEEKLQLQRDVCSEAYFIACPSACYYLGVSQAIRNATIEIKSEQGNKEVINPEEK